MSRPVRDILAESMRLEVYPLITPTWSDLVRFNDAAAELMRKRADIVIRLLGSRGVTLMRTEGAERGALAAPSDTIYRFPLVDGSAERAIRWTGTSWEVLKITAGAETMEQAFDWALLLRNVGLVLTDAPEAKSIPMAGRQLAAGVEILRHYAERSGK